MLDLLNCGKERKRLKVCSELDLDRTICQYEKFHIPRSLHTHARALAHMHTHILVLVYLRGLLLGTILARTLGSNRNIDAQLCWFKHRLA